MQDNRPELPYRNLPLLLLQTYEAVFANFRPILTAAGLTGQQWRVIRALVDHEALEPRQLCKACCLSSPSLAGILARMDDLGLVQRRRLAHDQRRLHVSLTPKGLALANELGPRVEQAYRELEERLGARINAQLYRSLDQALERLDIPPLDQLPE